ncbi:hypothetical protein [Sodalis sp. dw_96]|uniref:hypothetical protein n=1 Tax=Sodalis sp. dw_96 TaxID=2719794 RepID=UPI001BD4B967|nr:hypothetical protein [Sodalis sp. dw_96]
MEINENWATCLVTASCRLNSMAYLPNMLPGYKNVYFSLTKMFTKFSAVNLPRARAWVGRGELYTITDDLIKLAPQKNFELEQRLACASGAEKFCVTLNGLSAWCTDFALQMQSQMMEPLFRALGKAPQCGADFYSFFGNYGYTPFGVHDDTDHSLLWHLGPAPKTAYIWPRAAYINLTHGTLATTDYQKLLPYACRIDLKAGDLLFIPQGDFHILETQKFSATLGLTLFPDDPALECLEGARLLISSGKTLSSMGSAVLTLEQLSKLRRLALQSNGHIITKPQLGGLSDIKLNNAELQRSKLRVHPFWPLRHMSLADREVLLVRSRVMLAQANPLFSYLSEALAAGHPVSFAYLTQRSPGKITTEMITKVVRKIASLGGVVIEPI